MTDKDQEKPEPLDVYNEEHLTRAPKGYRITIDRNTGDIVSHGPRQPPPEWIPSGWVQISPNRWAPNWPNCTFRRLNIKINKRDPPVIQPLCIKYNQYGEEIDVDTCLACTVYRSEPPLPQRPLAFKELTAIMGRDFSLLKTEDMGNGEPYQYLTEMSEMELEQLEEREFQRFMEGLPHKDPAHMKNHQRLQYRWDTPCAHRIYVNKSDAEIGDCGGCSVQKIVCNNPEAEAFGKKLTRKICQNCPVAESPEERQKLYEIERDTQWQNKQEPKNG